MVLILLQHRTLNTQLASETLICDLPSCQKVRSLSRSRVVLRHMPELSTALETPEVSVWAAFANSVLDVLFWVCFLFFSQALVLQETNKQKKTPSFNVQTESCTSPPPASMAIGVYRSADISSAM